MMKKIKIRYNLIFLFIFFEIILFIPFVLQKSYNPSIDPVLIIIFSYLIGMIYLFFSESSFKNFLQIYFVVVLYLNFTLRLGSLSNSIYCIEKSLRLFYFLFLFSLTLNFLKQNEYNLEFSMDKRNYSSNFIQSIFFLIFILFGFFTIEKINIKIYTFIFFVVLFIFLLSIRKFLNYIGSFKY